ncbi:MAG: hypothetical protein HQL38_06595 [Alphaproteobacteria bacterium]|nr:hypothetical protein [Alphaproteobacteria bacterium]MBF0392333.1 hypothetical protein [Alphaproteobacteria bacterium]
MVFTCDYRQAGLRHLDDAGHLEGSDRHLAAGYHYGFAAECAFKTVLEQAGFRKFDGKRCGNPIWGHFGDGANNIRATILVQSDRLLAAAPPSAEEEDETGADNPKGLVVTKASGRLATLVVTLLALADDSDFMDGWHTDMRYAPDGEVEPAQCVTWRECAVRAVRTLLF